MYWILGGIGVVVVIWTFWQTVSLLVWRKQNAPRRGNPVISRKGWVNTWSGFDKDKLVRDHIHTQYASRLGLDTLADRHEACVAEFTAKLQALCPHDDVAVVETEDYRELLWSLSHHRAYGPWGRRTVSTCELCGKVLEDKFEEYVDQTPPQPTVHDLLARNAKECR